MKNEALKIADELSWSEMDTDEIETWTKEAVTMLRQQQAEIEKKNTLLKMWEVSHPVKELTDEEIKKLMEVLPTIINTLTDDDLIQFARAIEERHGIK